MRTLRCWACTSLRAISGPQSVLARGVIAAARVAVRSQGENESCGDFSIAAKFTVGLYLLAVAFFLYAAGSLPRKRGHLARVAGSRYFAQSLGELLISALSFSMIR